MTTPSTPYRARGPALRRWAGASAQDMRVSDADRNDVADRLSKHYSDGRLDQAEFSERLDRAMSARTQSDLTGLLTDLPGGEESRPRSRPQPRPRSRSQRGRLGRVLLLVLLVVIAAAAGQALLRMYLVWVLIALVAFLWFRYGPWHRR